MDNFDVTALGYKFGLLPVMNEEDDQIFYANIDELRRYTEQLVRECANIAYNRETVDEEQKIREGGKYWYTTSDAILEHFGLKQ